MKAIQPSTPVESIRFERAKNGGLISHTRHMDPPRKPGAPYRETPQPLPGAHSDVEDAVAHLRASFPSPKAKKLATRKAAPRMGAGAAAIGNRMLGGGVTRGQDNSDNY